MPGMIVAPQPLAVEEGAKVLARGGNAFDAAIACAFVQFLTDPHSCGVGGYTLLTCRPAGAGWEQPILDAPALAGELTSAGMWEDRVIGPNPSGWGFFLHGRVNEDGFQSVCTPGTVLGLETMHRRWGSLPWRELLAPAIGVAEEGFPVHAHLAARWKDRPNYYESSSLFQKLHASPEAQRIYLKEDGSAYDIGERLRNPDYAATIDKIASGGSEEFYHGDLGAALKRDLATNGSFVTAADFDAYAVRDEPPVLGTYRGRTVQTAQPPHGGPTLIAILNILEGYELGRLNHNSPEYIYLVSMAMKAAFADRNRHLGDPRFVDVPLEWMVSKERAAEWRAAIDRGDPISTERVQPGSRDTTQVSVVDRHGNCVSLTHSLGSSSGAITPGTGFMWNNSMVNFHPYAGHPNSIAPGKGRTTGMAPTIVYQGSEPVLVLGAPGATRILNSVLQVILNRLDFGMGITEAVVAPRFDCQGDTITCQSRIPEYVCAAVRSRHPIVRSPRAHGDLALIHAIAIDPNSGALSGAADTGADGMALTVPDPE